MLPAPCVGDAICTHDANGIGSSDFARRPGRGAVAEDLYGHRTRAPASQTRSFATIALIELWGRFGYYCMQALIVYFMVQRMGFDEIARHAPLDGDRRHHSVARLRADGHPDD